MLNYLHIENIAVIENANIEPVAGFNALTGETGAGKSIIIDSLNAVLGERTSKELIRNGTDKAVVSAVFSGLSKSALDNLRENGFDLDEDGNLIIQRVLSMAGNGSIKINGQPATAAVLREIGKTLINIHGQHDSQMLLKPENHYLYLDLLAANGDLLHDYTNEFRHFNEIRRQIKSLEMDEDKKYERMDLLRYQIDELEKAEIKPGELEKLKQAQAVAQNYEKIVRNLNDCLFALNGDDDSEGAVALAGIAAKALEKSGAEPLGDAAADLSGALEALHSVADSVRSFIEDSPYSKEDAEKIDERLDLLHRLMVKYGDSEEKMLATLDSAREELETIAFSEEKLSVLEEELTAAEQKLVAAGERLTRSRREAAKRFEDEVCAALESMDMNGVAFLVRIEKGRYTKTGCDTVEFLISANAGESVKPLYKVASGGELSRVMLAIKSIIADKDNVDTLIFDEIDTGISGRAASKVAVRLKKVAAARQVICVTHLAQIAAAAEGHFLIEKTVSDQRTYTSVTLLNDDARVQEIARIMSGMDTTENTINSAKELLDRSKRS